VKILYTKSSSCSDSDETSWYDLSPGVCERNEFKGGEEQLEKWKEITPDARMCYLNYCNSQFETATGVLVTVIIEY
jgi:hypothetical protein